jgi:hypothetical protein
MPTANSPTRSAGRRKGSALKNTAKNKLGKPNEMRKIKNFQGLGPAACSHLA